MGNTSSKGPFSIAMLVYRSINTLRFRGDEGHPNHHLRFGEPGSLGKIQGFAVKHQKGHLEDPGLHP